MIFYFSATGNTRWAARKVAQITGEKLYSIPDVVKDNMLIPWKEMSVLASCFLFMAGVRPYLSGSL